MTTGKTKFKSWQNTACYTVAEIKDDRVRIRFSFCPTLIDFYINYNLFNKLVEKFDCEVKSNCDIFEIGNSEQFVNAIREFDVIRSRP